MSERPGKLIINAAITGMVPTKADNPATPVTPDEIAADVRACVEAGAAIVHIHARDEEGKPTYRPDVYREILTKTRAIAPDFILCVTTSGRLWPDYERRSQVLDLDGEIKPEMASLTLGSLNFPKSASVNEPDVIRKLAEHMRERGIQPELEIFDFGMADYGRYLIGRGVLEPPFYANLLLGSLGTLSASAYNLAALVRSLPEEMTWAAAGIGRFQFWVNSMALAMGGNVRVGLEDSVFMDVERTDPATNARLIERVAALARAAGRELATPAEARVLIGLPQRSIAGPAALA